MKSDQIEQLLLKVFSDSQVTVTGPDEVHFEAVIVSKHFINKNSLARQRMVYEALGDHIKNGTIHALTMKTYTPDELNK